MEPSELAAVVRGVHRDPHRVLGVHPDGDETVFRHLAPGAERVWLVEGERELEPVGDGLFELRTAEPAPTRPYQLGRQLAGRDMVVYDPYCFPPTVGELDTHLIAEGRHYELHRVLGARPLRHAGVEGVAFTVWAPAARAVRVVGDFNRWQGRGHAMRLLNEAVWELFVPGLGPGAVYKLEIVTVGGKRFMKTDPVAQAMELRPRNASVVTQSKHRWGDDAWMEKREQATDAGRLPLSIYEVHLGSWRHRPGPRQHEDRPNWLSYRELADSLVDYVADLGFTHVELLPVMEHPYDGSWGYQVGGYYAPTCRYGTPDDLRHLIDRFHQRGIGVLMDWVPAHFPKDGWALGRFDGTALYEHLDWRKGEHKQWGTYIFNYGRNEVRNFLVANALYWLEAFHVDGLRCDAVASMLYLDYAADDPHQWVPNAHGGRENLEAIALLRELNDAVHERIPGALMIAEESTAWPGVTHGTRSGGLGFDLKWNMGWMHDTLSYFALDPVFRSFNHSKITFGLWYAFSERFALPLSHDEVVHMKGSLFNKMSGDRWRRFANLRSLYAHMWAHPGKKLMFMGGELATPREWSEARELDWALLEEPSHAGVQQLVRDLNRAYRAQPALWEACHEPRGFKWIDCNDSQQSVISYLRFPVGDSPDPATHDLQSRYLVCVANLTPVPRRGYRLGVPRAGRHKEILNTDAAVYGGSGMGNMGSVLAEATPSHGFPASLSLTLPPLAVIWLTPDGP